MAIERVSIIGAAQPVKAEEARLADLGLKERADLPGDTAPDTP